MYNPNDVKIIVGGNVIEEFADDNVCITFKSNVSGFVDKEPERIKAKQVEVYYDVIGAGPVGHPEVIFEKVCQQQRWDMIEATPHSIGDCWIFKVQMYNDSSSAYLPSYIKILE